MKAVTRIAMFMVLAAGITSVVLVPLRAHAALSASTLFTGGYWGGGDTPIIPCTGIFNISGGATDPYSGVQKPDTLVDQSQTAIYGADGKPTGAYLPTCQSLCDILELLQRLLYFGLTILMYVIVPLMVFVGGFMLLTGGGNPSQRSTAMGTIYGAVIGLAIGLGAYLIVNTFLWLIFTNTSTPYSYTGDALKSGGAQVTWPNITCAPNAQTPIVPNTPANPVDRGTSCVGSCVSPTGNSCPSGASPGVGVCSSPGLICCQ